jgi:hypothetical protein
MTIVNKALFHLARFAPKRRDISTFECLANWATHGSDLVVLWAHDLLEPGNESLTPSLFPVRRGASRRSGFRSVQR